MNARILMFTRSRNVLLLASVKVATVLKGILGETQMVALSYEERVKKGGRGRLTIALLCALSFPT